MGPEEGGIPQHVTARGPDKCRAEQRLSGNGWACAHVGPVSWECSSLGATVAITCRGSPARASLAPPHLPVEAAPGSIPVLSWDRPRGLVRQRWSQGPLCSRSGRRPRKGSRLGLRVQRACLEQRGVVGG